MSWPQLVRAETGQPSSGVEDPRWLGELARGLVGELADVVWAIRLEPEFGFTYVSDDIAEVLGHRASAFLADPALIFNVLHPSCYTTITTALERAVGTPTEFTASYVHASGSTVWMRNRCMKVQRGSEQMIVGVAFDVTSGFGNSDPLESYRSLAEDSIDVALIADEDGAVIWVTPPVVDLLGWVWKEIVGNCLMVYVAEEDRDVFRGALAHLEAGESVVAEVRLTTRCGEQRWVSLNMRPFQDPVTGRPRRITLLRDVDEQVRAREALAQSERRYRLLAENSSDVVCEVRNHRLYWVSPSVTAALGWKVEELVGQTLEKVLHPADRRGNSMLWRAAQAGTRPVRERLVRVRERSGRYRWMSARITPVSDDGIEGIVVGLHSVDSVVQARARAEREEERLRRVLDSLLDPHVLLAPRYDSEGNVEDFSYVEANAAATQYLGLDSQALRAVSFRTLFPGESAGEVVEAYADTLIGDGSLVVNDFCHCDVTSGECTYFDLRVVHTDGLLSVTWRDVTERHSWEEQLTELATQDPLTGLANRTALLGELRRAVEVRRRSGRELAVLIVDLDSFKNINDSLGHSIGDEVLRQAAGRIQHVVRAGDITARLGGDEFVVVLRDPDDGEDAVMMAAMRILEVFSVPFAVESRELYTTVSIGVAVARERDDAESLLRDADTAMYAAKRKGRNRIYTFNEELRKAVTTRLSIEDELRGALERGELVMHYQPEIEMSSGRITATEALLRWQRSDGELWSAGRFIEVAEETGMIKDIGMWVFGEVCTQTAAWQAVGYDLTVRVNFSAVQLSEPGLLAEVDEILARTGVDVRDLCAEITETTLLHSTAMALENLEGLHARGLHLAADDFGTGYASLNYLRRYPIDVLKIDRSFVEHIIDDDFDRRLVSGIQALAGALGMSVTVEGVECPKQAQVLAALGCERAQGWLWSPAVPALEFAEMLERGVVVASAA